MKHDLLIPVIEGRQGNLGTDGTFTSFSFVPGREKPGYVPSVPEFPNFCVSEFLDCLPENLRGRVYYQPTNEGIEKRIRERLEEIKRRRSQAVRVARADLKRVDPNLDRQPARPDTDPSAE